MIQRYRAWDNVKKEMFKDTFAITESGQVVVVEQESVASSPDYVFVDNLVIMQSTGLKDEFDKELFEGDIIEWSYWDEFEDSGTAKIIFDKGMFKLLDVRTEKSVWDNLFDCIENCNVFLQGNIYENRELLEEKERNQKNLTM